MIANKEENPKDRVLALAEKVPVFVTDVYDFTSAIRMIEAIGELTDRSDSATAIIETIRQQFDKFAVGSRRKAVYLIWRKPYMTVNGNTFISAMMQKAGFENVFAGKPSNYPEIAADEIKELEAEVVLLSSEPYRFTQKHIAEFQALLPNAKILLVDGEMFTWYGSRMQYAARYFKGLQDLTKNTV